MSVFTIDMDQYTSTFDDQYNILLQGKMNEIEFSDFINGCNEKMDDAGVREAPYTFMKSTAIHFCVACLDIIFMIVGLVLTSRIMNREPFAPLPTSFYVILTIGILIFVGNIIVAGFFSCRMMGRMVSKRMECIEDLREYVREYCLTHNIRDRGMNIVVKEKTIYGQSHFSPRACHRDSFDSDYFPTNHSSHHDRRIYSTTVLYLEFQLSTVNVNFVPIQTNNNNITCQLTSVTRAPAASDQDSCLYISQPAAGVEGIPESHFA